MKIAFIVGEFPSLSETFIINQITGLMDKGHEITIFAHKKREEQKIHPDVLTYQLDGRCTYHHMPKNKMKRLTRALSLAIRRPRLLLTLNAFKYGKSVLNLEPIFMGNITGRQTEHDIIFCHFGTMGNLGAVLRDLGLIKGKLVTIFHGNDLSAYLKKRGNRVYDFLLQAGDLFMPISDSWARKLVDLGCAQDKIIVHRMGIQTDKFTFQTRSVKEGETINITSIARLVEKKGMAYSIQAIASVVRTQPNIQYQIVGDGPLKSQLEQQIEELRLHDQVKLLGWKEQNEVLEVLNNTHIFLAPSVTAEDGDQEGIPVVLMEALSMGIPVVSTFHSGIPELIQDGHTGLLVPEKDVDAMADKILELIIDEQKRLDMARNGRVLVEQHYDVVGLSNRLDAICTTLMKGTLGHEHINHQRSFLAE